MINTFCKKKDAPWEANAPGHTQTFSWANLKEKKYTPGSGTSTSATQGLKTIYFSSGPMVKNLYSDSLKKSTEHIHQLNSNVNILAQ